MGSLYLMLAVVLALLLLARTEGYTPLDPVYDENPIVYPQPIYTIEPVATSPPPPVDLPVGEITRLLRERKPVAASVNFAHNKTTHEVRVTVSKTGYGLTTGKRVAPEIFITRLHTAAAADGIVRQWARMMAPVPVTYA